MRTANRHFINSSLVILTIAEAERGAPLELDCDDEQSSKAIFREHIVPFVREWPQWRQDKLHVALAYYMDRPEILDRVLAEQQDLTLFEFSDICRFFRWLWETLYPGEDYRKFDLSDVVENNDWLETNPQPRDLM
jgi:hypothetical protein